MYFLLYKFFDIIHGMSFLKYSSQAAALNNPLQKGGVVDSKFSRENSKIKENISCPGHLTAADTQVLLYHKETSFEIHQSFLEKKLFGFILITAKRPSFLKQESRKCKYPRYFYFLSNFSMIFDITQKVVRHINIYTNSLPRYIQHIFFSDFLHYLP